MNIHKINGRSHRTDPARPPCLIGRVALAALAALVVCPVRAGEDEFLVNTHTNGEQQFPRIAPLASGGFVIVWVSSGQDGDREGIYGQIFDAQGRFVGGEIPINSHTIDSQTNPNVAAFHNGDFIVMWQSEGQDGDRGGIFAQRFNQLGQRIGNELAVNPHTENQQWDPAVAPLTDGTFVGVWQSSSQDGGGWGIYGQRFDATNTRSGSEFRANDYTAMNQHTADITALLDGGFVVVWVSDGQDGSQDEIYGQRFSRIGEKIGGEFRVNTELSGSQTGQEVATLVNNEFVVVWASFGQDGDGWGVYGQRFDAMGNRLGGEFSINTNRAGQQNDPAVAGLSNGDFVVAWQGDSGGESRWDIFGQRFDQFGDKRGGEIKINNFINGSQQFPDVVGLKGGGFVASWTSVAPDSNSAEIYARLFPPSLSERLIPLGADLQINSVAKGHQLDPDAIDLGGGKVLYTWHSLDQPQPRVVGRLADSAGRPTGSEFDLSALTNGSQVFARATRLPAGGFAATWSSKEAGHNNVYARIFDDTGQPRRPEFRVNGYTDSDQEGANLVAIDDRRFVATWSSFGQDGDNYGVYARLAQTSGVFDTADIQLNEYFRDRQSGVRIAKLQSGRLICVWYSVGQDGDSREIYGQLATSQLTKVGTEFKINSHSAAEQSWPDVAALSNGGFVVTWSSFGQDGSKYGAYYQLFNVNGLPIGVERRANIYTAGDQVNSVVTGLPDDGFVIAWDSEGQDGSGFGVYGRRFDRSGAALTGEVPLNSYIMGNQTLPRLALLGSHQLLAVWPSVGQDGDGAGVFARVFDLGFDLPAPASTSEWPATTTPPLQVTSTAGPPVPTPLNPAIYGGIGAVVAAVACFAMGALAYCLLRHRRDHGDNTVPASAPEPRQRPKRSRAGTQTRSHHRRSTHLSRSHSRSGGLAARPTGWLQQQIAQPGDGGDPYGQLQLRAEQQYAQPPHSRQPDQGSSENVYSTPPTRPTDGRSPVRRSRHFSSQPLNQYDNSAVTSEYAIRQVWEDADGGLEPPPSTTRGAPPGYNMTEFARQHGADV